jgi:cytochrome c
MANLRNTQKETRGGIMRFKNFAIAAAAVTGVVFSVGAAQAAGDAANGEGIFKKKCAVCHAVEEGKNKVGPSLHGVVGRQAGTVDGFRYSSAMQSLDVVWDAETLDPYLEDPRGVVKGTRMAFPGLKDAGERADVIAYLETL